MSLFLIGCKRQDLCQCDLFLEVTDLQKGKRLVAGQNEYVSFELKITNTGIEPAYGAKVEISSNINLPEEVASTGDNVISFVRTGVGSFKI